ncbi:hypothetical protein GCM10010182_23900 [Actinomadura cremea]|nr:hypothetical protein GCM10010182_23900 [Actinomadura cremea]
MIRAVAAVLAAVLVTAGCGVRPTGTTAAGPRPVAGGEADDITVYLVKDGRLTVVTRPGLPGHPYLPITQLSVPPTGWEQRQGLRTDVPGALEPLPGVGGTVGLQIRVVPGPWPVRSKWPRTALAQIACTADAIPGVNRVILWDPREGSARRLTCEEFAGLLGGAPVVSPPSSR